MYLYTFWTLLLFACVFADDEYPKVVMCRGAASIREGRYSDPSKWLRSKFQRCTHINGHLPVIFVERGDLSFLNSIVEVYGMVHIKYNRVPVPLTNLRVIRGLDLDKTNVSLKVYKNRKNVDLRSLRSIVYGDIVITKNYNECYLPTIDWSSLIEHPKKQKVIVAPSIFCKGKNPCNSTCNGRCWGPTSELCQKSRKCSSGDDCCHKMCIGGCTGSTAKDCVACRNFINVDECVASCPPKYIRNVMERKTRPNPDFKYEAGLFCRKECPIHYFIQDKSCLSECNEGFYLKGRRECDECPNRICPPDHCRMSHLREKLSQEMRKKYMHGTMHRTLIKMLVNCTSLFGDIDINSVSGNPQHHLPGEVVRYKDLFNLRNLRHIRGAVHIDLNSFHEATNLSFFSSLESITSHETGRGLQIFNGAYLVNLGLVRLRELVVEAVIISRNPRLCFLERFRQNFVPALDSSKVLTLANNARDSFCKQHGRVCDAACDPHRGCWGAGPSLCVACARHKADGKCVTRCEDENGFYTIHNVTDCKRCHGECAKSCPRADQCVGGCRNNKDGASCVKACPFDKFVDNATRRCLPCASACASLTTQATCSGPLSQAGPNGCTRCYKIVAEGVPFCFDTLPSVGFYEVPAHDHLKRFSHLKDHVDAKLSSLLFHCHSKCLTCFGPGPRSCRECQNPFFKEGTFTCTEKCPIDTYQDLGPPNATKNARRCLSCDTECLSCNGSSNFNCTTCKHYKVFLAPEREAFFCNTTCPPELPYDEKDELGNNVCVKEERLSASTRLALSVAVPVFLIVAFVVMIVISSIHVWKRRARIRLLRENLHAKYTGRLADEQICLNVTNVQPNASQLRVIGISWIKKGNVIGSGAFGTVYKGVWTTEPEDESEIPVQVKVAIKELKNQDNKRSTEEFLSEARLMASVDNQYCIKLLGVCMTNELMLISEFMPLGNLKDYLQTKREELGSKRLLLWAIQIAKGMDYLATRDIVHRDLAARNVLLESEDQLRITDFGLAKLVDHGREFQDFGQRLPIKWLACECIRSQIFSTKSDVWAFGVTLWEMFTFGAPPYNELRAIQLLPHLDSGERLPQPAICTLDMYMLMIKCWLADPISRPTFEELLYELKKMASDPGRYLIIEGDQLRRAPLRSVSSITANSIEGAQAACAKGPVAVVDFDFAAAANKCLETSADSGELLNDHYVADPTSAGAANPEPLFNTLSRRPPPAITESFEENDEVFAENDYERPRALQHAWQASDYVAPSDGASATPSPGVYMNLPDTMPLLVQNSAVSNPTYSTPLPDNRRPRFDEAVDDYPLTPRVPPSQYVNIRF